MTPRSWVLGLEDFCLSFDFYWIVLISLRTFNSLLDEIGCYYRAYDKHNNNIICYKFGITRHFLIPKDSILKGFQLVLIMLHFLVEVIAWLEIEYGVVMKREVCCYCVYITLFFPGCGFVIWGFVIWLQKSHVIFFSC